LVAQTNFSSVQAFRILASTARTGRFGGRRSTVRGGEVAREPSPQPRDRRLGPAVGASGEHAAFPGTLSIGAEALTACLIELGRHASLHWPALLMVNGHGGNVTAVEAAVGRLRYDGRACLAWHATLPEGDAHAGRSETSVMLALAPGTVRLDAAERDDVRPLAQILPLLRERGVRAVSANGVLGDPAGASAAEGEHLLARLVDSLSTAIDQFRVKLP
jgi:mycofactocin precursor peptide peptidase